MRKLVFVSCIHLCFVHVIINMQTCGYGSGFISCWFIFKMTTVNDIVLILLLENLSIHIVFLKLCLVSTINTHALNSFGSCSSSHGLLLSSTQLPFYGKSIRGIETHMYTYNHSVGYYVHNNMMS